MGRHTKPAQPVRVGPAALLRLVAQLSALGALTALVLVLPVAVFFLVGQAFNSGRPIRYTQQDINEEIQRGEQQRQAEACQYSASHGGPDC